MSNQPLTLARRDAVLTLTLNRPEQRNALDGAMYAALGDALDAAALDEAVRVVALRGTGRHFSAGVDLARLREMLRAPREESFAHALLAARVLHRLATFPKPTVVAVQGGAFGGGLGLVLACDVALAAEDARFSAAEVRLGLFPGLVAPLFAAVAGRRTAGRYLLTGDPFDAAAAQRMGVVHEVMEAAALEAALEAATARIAGGGPGAVAGTKRLLWDERYRLVTEWDIDWIADEVVRHRATAEAAEGVQAFLDKRLPRWD